MKKIIGLGAAALCVPAAIASAVLFSHGVAGADPNGSVNVVGEPYYKAIAILKSQGVAQRFNGAFSGPGGPPQSMCIVDQQKATSKGLMLLHLDCTKEAADHATDSTPATSTPPAAGGPASGGGQGTYGGPIGVPVPVG